MKKLINCILVFTFIITHVMIELYPTIKMGAKIYASKLNFERLLNSEPIAEYMVYLSDKEKGKLINMVTNYCNNILK